MNLLASGALGVGGFGQLVGFRPEDVQLGNGRAGAGQSARYEATVEVVQYLGDEQLAYLRLGEAEVVAKLPLDPALETGGRETFSVPLRKLHFFEAETGAAVA
jgi:multiple sugar transport system ATP-binding protein